jgi:hypothetical protein
MSKILAAAASLMLFAGVSNAFAGVRLTDSQMDRITAGSLSVTASASALAVSTANFPANATVLTHTFNNGHVASGFAFADSYGNLVSTTTANVTVSGGEYQNEWSRTITLQNGTSISIAHGIAIQ